MPSWIGQSIARGILTTRYPRDEATEGEVPPTGRPPQPVGGTSSLAAGIRSCPVGAITETTVDQGKCIRCARCLPKGFAFTGSVESAALSRETLRTGPLPPSPRTQPVPPLVDLGPSVHVFMIDVGSCNACNLEVLALANPFYDSQRLGIFFTNSPRHADVLLIVGVPTREMVEPLRRAYDALPEPKAVMAVGACPISGGLFAGTPGVAGELEKIVSVDAFVPGCPPSPVNILDGLLRLSGRGRRAREV
ncbi:MAG: NADH:ubiquinone oxidoreductase [Thermoplasmata archaeon]